MNILVIGNGFDRAHNLETDYVSFLNFVKNKSYDCINKNNIEEFTNLTKDNIWINYFNNELSNIGKKWIDFEKEISKYVRLFENKRDKGNDFDNWTKELNNYEIENIEKLFPDFTEVELFGEDYKSMKARMLKDLNNLTRAYEIYCCYINTVPVEKIPLIESLKAYKVLSFNYTKTYKRLYGNENVEYDYIHGIAEDDSNYEKCNLVLGIDANIYDSSNLDFNDFIQFRKYYQRIVKKTGCEYKNWLDRLNKIDTKNPGNKIIFYGHSLDITDGDVLKELFECKNVSIIIYYLNEKALGDYVANLVKLLGKDEMIKNTSGENPRIVFEEIK